MTVSSFGLRSRHLLLIIDTAGYISYSSYQDLALSCMKKRGPPRHCFNASQCALRTSARRLAFAVISRARSLALALSFFAPDSDGGTLHFGVGVAVVDGVYWQTINIIQISKEAQLHKC